jgi:hypothetical protein
MKALALFLVAALLALFVGCEDPSIPRVGGNPVEPIAPGKANLVKTLQINERVAIATPEGLTGFADVVGEITYAVTSVTPSKMAKEIPIKPVYSVNISARGEVAPTFLQKGNALTKPNTWTFNSSTSSILEDGGNLLAAFQLEGTKYRIAHLHMEFVFANGQLYKDMLYADFHSDAAE